MKDRIQLSHKTFLNFPDERLLVATRQHWIVLLPPILFISLGGSFLIVLSVIIFSILLSFHPGTILTVLLITSIISFLTAKIIVEWFFHLYIITNRKILEFSYIPLSHFMVNDVILDEVRCTEIDVQANGVLNDLLDIGEIIITFDRPTHQEEFSLNRIHKARETASFLTLQLIDLTSSRPKKNVSENWFKLKSNPHKYRRQEDIVRDDAFEPNNLKEKIGGVVYE
jgi:hypothetical protein